MDPNAYQLTFPVFVGAMILVAWFFIARQIRTQDERDKEDKALALTNLQAWQARVDSQLKEGDKEREAMRLALADKLSREELEKIFDEIKRVESVVGDRLDKFLTAMAVGQHKQN